MLLSLMLYLQKIALTLLASDFGIPKETMLVPEFPSYGLTYLVITFFTNQKASILGRESGEGREKRCEFDMCYLLVFPDYLFTEYK
jgi:hypothetical protein